MDRHTAELQRQVGTPSDWFLVTVFHLSTLTNCFKISNFVQLIGLSVDMCVKNLVVAQGAVSPFTTAVRSLEDDRLTLHKNVLLLLQTKVK